MLEISGVKSQYYSIAERLGAPKKHIHFATTPQDNGSPHIETAGDAYSYIITERGSEYERQTTTDPDELLYWLISDLTWSMACDYEMSHRRTGEDQRQLLFQKHLELLGTLNKKWADRKQAEYKSVLQNNPFSKPKD